MAFRNTIKYIRSLMVTVLVGLSLSAYSQINTEQVMRIGQNSLYFEDYMLSIQYFNQVIQAKPYQAKPYFLRAIAKYNLDDFAGAEADASMAIELNPYITDAYEVRGVSRQYQGKLTGAIEDYKQALTLLPRNRQLMFNLALAQEENGDIDDASQTFAALLEAYPSFDNGYIGRAQMYISKGDTVAALNDIQKALELNKNSVNGYLMRANLAIQRNQDYEQALADMDEAIKLQPKYAGFFINRAFLRYMTGNYFGAMADYDYAITREPMNQMALFNRGLLEAEVSANDRALVDFTKVLELDPDDYRSLYNRALIYRAKGMYKEAIGDISRVIDAFPDLAAAYYTRMAIYSEMGNQNMAMRDYDKAEALIKRGVQMEYATNEHTMEETETKRPSRADRQEESEEAMARRFATLLTLNNDPELVEEFNNKDIRGKVQDRKVAIEIEPMMELTYHYSPTELKQGTNYIKEVDDLNATRALRFIIVVTAHPAQLTNQEDIAQHFTSIEYYNGYMATHSPRTVDYIGRAMDFVTVHNYPAAIKDLTAAIELTPDFPVSYMLRAQARYHNLLTEMGTSQSQSSSQQGGASQASSSQFNSSQFNSSQSSAADAPKDAGSILAMRRMAYQEILEDLQKVISLSPRTPEAYYNMGNLQIELQDLTSAIASYTKAIELKPDMGEAYYNRGYAYLTLGNKRQAIADLSKAGELGILPSYNLLKMITN